MIYDMDCRVRYSETDSDGKASLNAILDYFQDCATFHTQDIGIGFKDGLMKNRGWFLLAYEVAIDRAPEVFEHVKIRTESYHMRRYYGYRRFTIIDEAGEAIVKADSIWMLMDLNRLVPVKVPDEMSSAYVREGEEEKVTIKRKISTPKEWDKLDTIVIRKSHIDTNIHVNNSWYARWAQEYVPEGMCIKNVKIDYRKAAVLGDCIDLYKAVEGEEHFIQFVNQDGVLLAIIKMEFTGRKEENLD